MAERRDDGAWQPYWRRAGEVGRTHGAKYLESRGIAATLAENAGVRFAARYFGRPAVLFPLVSQDENVSTVHGRYIDGDGPRMRTAGPKSDTVFETHGSFRATEVAVTEAPIDALSLASLGIPSLALCGTSWPDWLPRHLRGKTVRVAFDADEAGDIASANVAKALLEQGVDWTGLRPRLREGLERSLARGPRAALLSLRSELNLLNRTSASTAGIDVAFTFHA